MKNQKLSPWSLDCTLEKVSKCGKKYERIEFDYELFVGKPKDIDFFLTPFINEITSIFEKGGVVINGKKTIVKIRCFICDTPARAALKGIHQCM